MNSSLNQSNLKGVIYILTNPAFPEYVKIGYANNLEQRMRELNQSEALPFAFRAYATYDVYERLTDKKLHELIDALNPDLRTVENFDGRERKREFYAMSKEDAYRLLECIAKISGTEERLKRLKPTGHEVLEEETAAEIENNFRKPPFRFSMIGIHPGDQVVFTKDPSVVATVVDDRRIEYAGEITSLSALAENLLGKSALQGTLFFAFHGKTLNDLREEAEKKAHQS